MSIIAEERWSDSPYGSQSGELIWETSLQGSHVVGWLISKTMDRGSLRVNASKLPFHVESIIVSFILIVPLDEQKEAGRKMDLKLELVPVPVSDVDRAKAFYVEKVGFHADHDVQPGNGMRIVQLTPPGSACSIVIGTGMGEISEMQPGTVKGLHLVVADINKAREAFGLRGVDVGEVDDLGGVKYVHFSDPDGNSWVLQEIPAHQ